MESVLRPAPNVLPVLPEDSGGGGVGVVGGDGWDLIRSVTIMVLLLLLLMWLSVLLAASNPFRMGSSGGTGERGLWGGEVVASLCPLPLPSPTPSSFTSSVVSSSSRSDMSS